METVANYLVPVAPPAMGLPKKHIYQDCQHIRNTVVRSIPATWVLLAAVPLCKACEKRHTKAQSA